MTLQPRPHARRAQYDSHQTEIVREGTVVQHYVLTRYGIVCREFLGGSRFAPLMTEVVLMRRGNKTPTFLGTVERRGDVWFAQLPSDAEPREHFEAADYIEAEAWLLPRKSGWRSQKRYVWPRWMIADIRNYPTGE